MTHRGPFQPLPFCDSVTSGRVGAPRHPVGSRPVGPADADSGRNAAASPRRFPSHLWERPGIPSHLCPAPGPIARAVLWVLRSPSPAPRVTASIPAPIDGEDAASHPGPALAARRVGGSGEGSGPSSVYTKLSSCRADAAQARTKHRAPPAPGTRFPAAGRQGSKDVQSHPAPTNAQRDVGPPAHPQGCRAEGAQPPTSRRQDRRREPEHPWSTLPQSWRWAGHQPARPSDRLSCLQRLSAVPSPPPSPTQTSQPSRVLSSTQQSSSHRVEQGSFADSHISSSGPDSAPRWSNHVPIGVPGRPGGLGMSPPPPPIPPRSEGSLNPSLGEAPGSERVAGGIICLGCRQTSSACLGWRLGLFCSGLANEREGETKKKPNKKKEWTTAAEL